MPIFFFTWFFNFFLPCFLTLGFLTTIIGLPIICLTTSGLPTLVCLTTSGFLISGVLITTTSGFLISGVLTGFPIFLTVAPICPKPSVRFCSCFGVGGGFFTIFFIVGLKWTNLTDLVNLKSL